jgi:hypothetical protein
LRTMIPDADDGRSRHPRRRSLADEATRLRVATGGRSRTRACRTSSRRPSPDPSPTSAPSVAGACPVAAILLVEGVCGPGWLAIAIARQSPLPFVLKMAA